MYLKTLTLHGFKSFAHPVQVALGPGLNVIVGPNGSGKSNLIDALRWVLGERRGGHQVLFHGSEKHRPVGMASVELLFEPSFRVEKRAFASGEVEYFFQGRKVRLADLRQELARIGLSLSRSEIGFVTNRDLHVLADLSPLERFRWLEETSGTLAMRARLAELSRMLQGVVAKRERFRERLREIAFQRARVAEWAKREEEYLQREKRWKDAQKTYYVRLLEKLRGDSVRLSEEASRCDQELHRILNERLLLALDADEQNLLTLRNRLSSLRREVEAARQKVVEKEQELYQLLTEMRHERKLYIALESRGKSLLERLDCLEKEKERLQAFPEISVRLERAEGVVVRFLEGKRAQLGSLREREREFREEAVRFETMLKNVEQELEHLRVRHRELAREVEDLEKLFTSAVQQGRVYESETKVLEKEKEMVQHRLARTKEVLARLRKALGRVEFQGASGAISEAIRADLLRKGWPNRAIHAFFGFLRNVRVLEGEEIPEDLGEWMAFCLALPPYSPEWTVEKRETLLVDLREGRELRQNCVALDGSLVALKGGFFLLPRKIAAGTRFMESWKKRESRFARRVQELERVLQEISRKIEETERRRREMEFRAVQWQERLRQRDEVRKEVERRIALLSAERSRLLKCLAEATERVREASQEVGALQRVISRAERTLKKIEEKKKQRDLAKRQYERFLWEVQKVREEILSVTANMRRGVENLWFLERQLVQCGRELGQLLFEVTAKEALLRDKEREEQSLAKSIEAKRQKERALEREREKWVREKERVRFTRERLRMDIERIENVLATLDGEVCPEWQAMDLEGLGKFVEEEERALSRTLVRRGAIEEYAELQSREEDLARQDALFEELITLVSLECKSLERDMHRQFLAFVDRTKDAFSQYFRRIFRGGQATLVVRDGGAHLEVEIPGKRKQGMALLSSGERTLVALCFLCACFEAGGAKMCFFDEIDANLDHTNSKLLAQVLKEFAAKRQVVVVTHKEEVMEVADRILGVTMNEPGVSQVLLCERF